MPKKGPIEKGADRLVSETAYQMQKTGDMPRGALTTLLSPIALRLARQCYLNGMYAMMIVMSEQEANTENTTMSNER